MPQRRRVLIASSSHRKAAEIERELRQYDIEVERCEPLPPHGASEAAAGYLRTRGESFWVKAVFRETTRVYRAPSDGLEGFSMRTSEVGSDGLPTGDMAPLPLEDGQAVIIFSLLEVFMLPPSNAARIAEQKTFQQLGALHTHPATTRRAEPAAPTGTLGDPLTFTYTHAVEAYVDFSQRNLGAAGAVDVFDWDDILVLVQTGRTYQDLLRRGLKYSPRDINVANWVVEHIHYKKRKATNFINEGASSFCQTIQFDEAHSVAAFVRDNRFFNNHAAVASGLRDVFVAVANNGAFFRAARTRREVNYWLPGLNAGIPFVAKRDPIHEITFTAHDFGHFLIPDLVYTGNNCLNARRAYIIYRMLSEATTMVFADMLFVETLRLAGHEYDWATRAIHPLFVETGVEPFGGSREHFLAAARALLEANVQYCLLGSDAKYVGLIEARRGRRLESGTCPALEAFKSKFMPFFVEDYKWTSANFANMSKRPDVYRRWWALAQPIAAAAGLARMEGGVGLETVDDFLAAIGVTDGGDVAPEELIRRTFARMFDTRIAPVLSKPGQFELDAPTSCLKNAFARYLIGQVIIFARFDFVPESAVYYEKLVALFGSYVQSGFTVAKAEIARSLYAQFLRILLRKALITTDDYANWQQICPLFDPVYVFYDESKEFYKELAEVQREILGG